MPSSSSDRVSPNLFQSYLFQKENLPLFGFFHPPVTHFHSSFLSNTQKSSLHSIITNKPAYAPRAFTLFTENVFTNSGRTKPSINRPQHNRKSHPHTQMSRARSALPLSTAAASLAFTPPTNPLVIALAILLGIFVILRVLWNLAIANPSRPYTGSFDGVGKEYDEWTNEGILEYYWGEHIHLGYYTDPEIKKGPWKKDFKLAKYHYTYKMLEWGTGLYSKLRQQNLHQGEFQDYIPSFDQLKANFASQNITPKTILDVGCGFGGTTRLLAKIFPDAQVTGITLSKEQVRRATELAKEQGVEANTKFLIMDALTIEEAFPKLDPNFKGFDLVWACESGEHMPDKKIYIDQMTSVLKPGGNLIVCTWCQRDTPPPFTRKEERDLEFLYKEWSHPYFVSKEKYKTFMEETGLLENVVAEDWCKNTINSWRHSIWVGIVDPWIVIFSFNPRLWYKVIREIICLEKMHQAFKSGLMEYGIMKATRKLN